MPRLNSARKIVSSVFPTSGGCSARSGPTFLGFELISVAAERRRKTSIWKLKFLKLGQIRVLRTRVLGARWEKLGTHHRRTHRFAWNPPKVINQVMSKFCNFQRTQRFVCMSPIHFRSQSRKQAMRWQHMIPCLLMYPFRIQVSSKQIKSIHDRCIQTQSLSKHRRATSN